MFIYNLKLNGKNWLKIFFAIAIIISIIFFAVSSYKIFSASNFFKTNDELNSRDIYRITTANYTNILKTVHDNLNSYIDQKIEFSGYVYRVDDINATQFILARDMIISSNSQTVVVGFLCENKNAANFKDKTWVKVLGTIKKGDYHGEIPIVKIDKIEEITKPSDEYVYPPDDSFIQTSALI